MHPRIWSHLACCLPLLVAACGGGGGGAEAPPPPSTQPPVAASAATIGPGGGVIEINAPLSPLDGTKIVIPAAALETSTDIRVEEIALPGTMPGHSVPAAGVGIELIPHGLSFKQPVTVTLGYDDADNDGIVDATGYSEESVAVLYTDGNLANWQMYHPIARDSDRNTVTFQTTHFSTYLSFVGDAAAGDNIQPQQVTTVFLVGEHFLADPVYTYDENGTPTLLPTAAPYYYLTITRPNQLASWVDSKPNLSGPGVPCSIAEDHLSCTFDAAAIFPKIAASNDTASWEWQCEFVAEHTVLAHYAVFDDALREDQNGTGIYCEMEAVDGNPQAVRITWGIDAEQEVYYTDHHSLVINFWANYRGQNGT